MTVSDELNELSVLTSEIAEYCQSTPADAGLSLTTGDLCCALFTGEHSQMSHHIEQFTICGML